MQFFKRRHPFKMNCDFKADGLGVKGKNLGFLLDPKFIKAWLTVENGAQVGWPEGVPDVRWRVHTAIWAASNGLRLDGDFVECGVHSGILTHAICDYFDFRDKARTFWLFDTWNGVPMENLTPAEATLAAEHNATIYHHNELFENVRESFDRHHKADNINFVQGILPESLSAVNLSKIAYLSIDLNNAAAEKGCIEILWPKLSSGAFVVIDDYAFKGSEDQQKMWDAFAGGHGRMVLTLPTGQGLLIK